MKNKLKKYCFEILLAAILCLFILLKLPALHLPYFWDELGVYSRAALYLHDNSLSLLPKALPPDLSRGHPLLFSFINAVWFHIAGDSVLSGHIISLCITLCLLVSIYYVCSCHFSKQAGLISIIFLLVQPVFFAQSVMMLPEICLALFMLLALHFWVKKKYALYCIMASAAILIKETAVLIPAVILFSEATLYFIAAKNRQHFFSPKKILFVFPLFIYAAFLYIQKIENGWYFFPYHIESVDMHLPFMLKQLSDFAWFLFIDQGRVVSSLFIIILILILLIKRKHFTIKTFPPISIYFIFLILGGLAFNSMNFFMNRYSLFILSVYAIIFSSLALYTFKYAKYSAVIMCIAFIVPLFYMSPKKFNYDENMSYIKYLSLQTQSIKYLTSNTRQGDRVFANFPMVHALQDERLGFIKNSDINYDLIKNKHPQHFQYLLLADPGAYDHTLPQADSLIILKTFENSTGKITLYKPKYP